MADALKKSPSVGVHTRGPGPGDSFSLPYFVVADLGEALGSGRGSRRHRRPPWRAVGDLQGLRREPVRACARRVGRGAALRLGLRMGRGLVEALLERLLHPAAKDPRERSLQASLVWTSIPSSRGSNRHM